MSEITRVGVDLAKRVIQVHAVNAQEKLVTNKALSRDKFIDWCVKHVGSGGLIAFEACSGAHHWARRLIGLGLDARIIAGHKVSAYRLQGKSGKNDANDAAAICEAASRPHMQYVAVKTVDQQGMLTVHRLREAYKKERTACTNRIRGLLAEFGVVFPLTTKALREGLVAELEDASNELNGVARMALRQAYEHWCQLDEHMKWCDQRIAEHLKSDEHVAKAHKVIGVGPVSASAAVVTVGQFDQFKNGAQLAAWLGLVPSQNSSGGKNRLGKITKRGDEYLRSLLIQGAKAAVMTAHKRSDPISQWACRLREKAGWQKAAVALANKNARILWAVMVKGKAFDAGHVSEMPGSAKVQEAVSQG